MAEEFTREEQAALAPYVTNLDGPVFALVNLPEVVKGALFARYSRTHQSLESVQGPDGAELTAQVHDAPDCCQRRHGILRWEWRHASAANPAPLLHFLAIEGAPNHDWYNTREEHHDARMQQT